MSECVTWCSIRLRGAACRLIVPPRASTRNSPTPPLPRHPRRKQGCARARGLAEVGVLKDSYAPNLMKTGRIQRYGFPLLCGGRGLAESFYGSTTRPRARGRETVSKKSKLKAMAEAGNPWAETLREKQETRR